MLRKSSVRESGNIFFVLFGAVAVVGLLGTTIVTTLRGPLSTMVEVQARTQAESEMAIASRLALLEATELTNNGDCDSDGFVEPLEYLDAGGAGPTGGGFLPNAVSSAKVDPWGTEYGYCTWDAGSIAGAIGCDTNSNSVNERLNGNGSPTDETYSVIAVISAGPDQVFNTTCIGGASPSTSKAGDDLVVEYTYASANAASGGLWNIKSGDPNVAEISKDIEVTGGATFTGGLDLTAPTAQVQLGAASLLFPDDTTLTACNGANDGLIRIDTSTNPNTLQLCDDPTGWVSVGGTIWQSGAGNDIFYNTGTPQVGIGNNSPSEALDVTGNIEASGNISAGGALNGATLSTTGNGTIGGNLGVTGASNLATVSATGAADFDSTLNADGATTLGSTVNVTGATTLSSTLDAQGNIGNSTGDLTLDDDIVVSGTSDLQGNVGNSTGDVILNDDLVITGSTDAQGSISNSTGNLTLSDNVDITNNLDVTGDIDATNITASSDVNASGNINVNGDQLGPALNCGAAQKLVWTNGTGWSCTTDLQGGTGGGAPSLNDITDVVIASPAGDQCLIYNGGTGNWGNGVCPEDLSDNTISELQNVSATGAAAGQILIFTGANWSNTSLSGDASLSSGGALTISDNAVEESMLNETNGPTDEYCLTYESSSANFEWQQCTNTASLVSSIDDLDDAYHDITTDFDGDAADNDDNLALGHEFPALDGTNPGARNTAIGATALDAVTTGDDNIAIGHNALSSASTLNSVIAIGSNAGSSRTSGSFIAIGRSAMSNASGSSGGVTALGNYALAGGSGDGNTAVGSDAMRAAGSSSRNTAIGAGALRQGAASGSNVSIGLDSMRFATSSSNNVVIGTDAGRSVSASFDSSVLVGHEAGNLSTTGARNVIIGFQTNPSSATASREINIGNTLFGNIDDTATAGVDETQFGVGVADASAINSSALVDFSSTTRGALFPRMDTAARDAIASPATGLMVFNTTDNNYQFYDGAAWLAIGNGTIAPDSLDWDDFTDTMTLDATTTIDMDTNTANLNFDSNTFVIDSVNNRVGIGTATPLSGLHVEGDSIRHSSSAGNVILRHGTSFGIIGTSTNTDFALRTNNIDRLRVDAGGNVGIGTATPGSTLTVNGNFAVRTIGDGTDAFSIGRDGSTSTLNQRNGPTTTIRLSSSVATQSFFNSSNFVFGDTTADDSALVEIDSTSQGFLPPRMTTVQRDGINSGTFATGLMVYNTDDNNYQYYDGTNWLPIGAGAIPADSLDWDDFTDTMTLDATTTIDMDTNTANLNFDNDTFVIDSATNNIGIDTASPVAALHINRNDNSSVSLRLDTNQASQDMIQIVRPGYNGGMRFNTGSSSVMRLEYGAAGIMRFDTNTDNIYFDNKIGIGTTSIVNSAQLQIDSTTAGFLPPRMTTAQRDAINSGTFATGLTVYNTTTNTLEFYDGTTWQTASSAIPADSIDWDDITDTMTLDATTTIDMDTNTADLNFDVNTLVIDSDVNRVGIGTPSPTAILEVAGTSLGDSDNIVRISEDGNTIFSVTARDGGTIGHGPSRSFSVCSIGSSACLDIDNAGLSARDHRAVSIRSREDDAGANYGLIFYNDVVMPASVPLLKVGIGANTATAEYFRVGSTGGIGIGTGAENDASSILQADSTSRGFLPPRMTTAQRNAINSGTFATGLTVYNTTTNTLQFFDGTAWQNASGTITANSIDWDDITDTMTLDATTTIDMDTNTANLNFDANTFVIDSTNNRLGIGTNTPTNSVHVSSESSNGIVLTDSNDSDNERAFIGIDGAAHGFITLNNNIEATTVHIRSHSTASFQNGVRAGSSGINDSSAILQADSTSRGFLPPRMTTVQRDAINSGTFATGLTVYNTTTNTLQFYDGTTWQNASSGSVTLAIDGLTDAFHDTTTDFDGDASDNDDNLALGHEFPALDGTNPGARNTAIGALSSNNLTTADDTVTIGYNAGNALTTGRQNVIVGSRSGQSLTGGLFNTLIGYSSGRDLSNADNNTLIGESAGVNITNSNNTAIGANTLFRNTNGVSNTVVGTSAGAGSTNGSRERNTIMGYRSGYLIEPGSNNNVFLGYQAGDLTTTGTDNIIIGYDIDPSSATASNELNIGDTIFGDLSTGNVGIGTATPIGDKLTVGAYETPSFTLFQDQTIGVYGTDAAYFRGRKTSSNVEYLFGVSSTDEVFVSSYTNDPFDIRMGAGDIKFAIHPDGRTGIGTGATTNIDASALLHLESTETGFLPPRMTTAQRDAINSGTFATGLTVYNTTTNTLQFYDGTTWQNASSGSVTLAIDGLTDAFHDTTTDFDGDASDDDDNLALGHEFPDLDGTNPGARNTAIGANSGEEITTGDDNIAIGYQAGTNITSGFANTLIGSGAGDSIEQGESNTVIGNFAGQSLRNSDHNTFIGRGAGSATQNSSNNNIAVGNASLGNNVSGSNNVMMGRNTASNGSNNATLANNTVIGHQAGYNLGNNSGDNAENNIFLGYQAGESTVQGDNNIIIGYDIDASSATASNEVNIGNLIYGSIADGTAAGPKNQVGIGVTDASAIDTSALLELASNTHGFLPPRMTTTQRDAINSGTFATGLTVYNTTTNTLQFYDGTAWQNASATAGLLAINDLTDAYRNATIGNTFIGHAAATLVAEVSPGQDNTVLGDTAGDALTTGSRNTFLGSDAGTNLTDRSDNIIIGAQAGRSTTTSYRSVIIGNFAGQNAGYQNTLVGERAGRDTTGTDNTFIGRAAGEQFTTGNGNIILGTQAEGAAFTSGNENIMIGYFITPSATTANREINIGNTIFGNIDNSTTGSTTETQIGIGMADASAINASAIFEVSSTEKGLLPPRMTTTQRDAINSGTFATGLTVYNTTTNTLQFYDGTAWQNAGGTAVTAAGADREIQFNDGGSLGASAAYAYNAVGDLELYGGGSTSGSKADFEFYRYRGTQAAPTAVQDGDQIGFIRFKPYSGSSYIENVRIGAVVNDSGITSTNVATDLVMNAQQNGGSYGTALRLFGSEALLALGTDSDLPFADGLVSVGSTGTIAVFGDNPDFEAFAVGTDKGDLTFTRTNGVASAPTTIADGDQVGALRWAGLAANGNIRRRASILGEVNGTVAGGNIPIDLVFKTTNSADDEGLERMRIAADGGVTFQQGVTANSTVEIQDDLNVGGSDLYVNAFDNRVGIGAAPNEASAILDITSTAAGFLPPRMTTAQRDAINSGTFATGLTVYNNTTNTLQFYDGTAWQNAGGAAASSNIDDLGDAYHDTTTDFDGDTTDNDDNLALGHEFATLDGSTPGARNTAIGATALDAVTTGDGNVAIGFDASSSITTGSNNIAIGQNALNNSTQGNGQITIGGDAGANLAPTTAFAPTVAIGSAALRNAGGNSGANAVVIGPSAARFANSAARSVIIGNSAGDSAGSNLNDNIFIGNSAGNISILNSTASFNIALGIGAGRGLGSATGNILIGTNADTSAAGSDNELNIGGAIFGDLSTSRIGIGVTNATAIDANAALEVTGTNLGFLPPRNTDPATNIAGTAGLMAYDSTDNELQFYNGTAWVTLADNGSSVNDIDDLGDAYHDTTTDFDGDTTDNDDNLALGHEFASLDGSTPGARNTAIGATSLDALTTGDGNAALGYNALSNLTTGTTNAAFGENAGLGVVAGSENTFMGQSAFHFAPDGSENVAVGHAAMASAAGNRNTAVGRSALNGAFTTTITNNTALGYRAGANIDGGSNNLFLGYQAGDVTTSGTDNIIIGYDIDASSATASNELNIGNTIFGDLANGNVGIGTTSPTGELDVHDTSGASTITISTDVNLGSANTTSLVFSSDTDGTPNVSVLGQFNDGSLRFSGAGNIVSPDMIIEDANGSIGMNTGSVDASAILEITATDRGFLPPRMTTAQRDAINSGTFATGLTVYNTTTNTLQFYDGTAWQNASASGGSNIDDLGDAYHDTTTDFDGDTNDDDDNLALGHEFTALDGTNPGARNTAVGATALDAVTTGDGNIGIGYNAGTAVTTASYNIAIGEGAGAANATLDGLITIGYNAGASTTTTVFGSPIFIGRESGSNITDAGGVVSIGMNSLFSANGSNVTATTAIGQAALFRAGTGVNARDNTAVGDFAGGWFGAGTSNVFIGKSSGEGDTDWSGSNNIFIGRDNATNLNGASSDNNIILGSNAAPTLTTGSSNIILGVGADVSSATSSNELNIGNTIFGNLSNNNVGIGTNNPGQRLTVLGGNIALREDDDGNDAAVFSSDGTTGTLTLNNDNNSFIVLSANQLVGNKITGSLVIGSTGAEANALDASAILELESASRGFLPPRMTTTQRDAINSGTFATGLTVYNTTTNTLQFYDGTAWQNAGGAAGVIAINDLTDASTSVSSVYMGNGAAPSATGVQNTTLGIETLVNATSGNNNTFVGWQAGGNAAMTDGQMDDNTALGERAGYNLSSGASGNIFIGARAGGNETNGDNNIIIGNDISTSGFNAQDELNIGNTIFGDLSTGNVGIGNNAPQEKLHVSNGGIQMHGDNQDLEIFSYSNGASEEAGLKIYRSRGTEAAPFTALADGDEIGEISFYGSTNSNFHQAAGISVIATNGGWTSGTAREVDMIFSVSEGFGDFSERMRIAAEGRVSIGTGAAADASALLELTSTDTGFLPPRMTTAQRDAINSGTFATGLTVYNTTTNTLQFYDGTAWQNTSGTTTAINDLTDAEKDTNNLFMGEIYGSSLTNATGNTSFGIGALDALTDASTPVNAGDNNTAFGREALTALQTGINNVAVGNGALGGYTAGSSNTAVGYLALRFGNGGDDNTALGFNAGANQISNLGERNTYLGSRAGFGTPNSTSVTDNVAVGFNAGRFLDTNAANNVLIGSQAGEIITTGTDNIIIGYNTDPSSATASNELNIGNTIYGDLSNDYIGIGNVAPDVALDVTGDIEYTGTLTDVSDRRLKDNITPLNTKDLLARISKIDTYSFTMKDDLKNRTEFGVMAQELEKIFPELVHTAKDEMGTKSVNYVGLIAPMIEATKELKSENEMLKTELAQMKSGQQEIMATLTSMQKDMAGIKVHTGFGFEKANAQSMLIIFLMMVLGGSVIIIITQSRKKEK